MQMIRETDGLHDLETTAKMNVLKRVSSSIFPFDPSDDATRGDRRCKRRYPTFPISAWIIPTEIDFVFH